MDEITRMQQGKFMYRCLNNLLPDNISDDYIKPISHRSNKELYIRRTNTNYCKFDIKNIQPQKYGITSLRI